MSEELMVSLAEIIQSRLTVLGRSKAVLRALAIAGKEELALLTLAGKEALFVLTEFLLSVTVHHFHERLLVNISELEFGKDEVVARIDIAIEFDDTGVSASLRHRADTGLFAHPIR